MFRKIRSLLFVLCCLSIPATAIGQEAPIDEPLTAVPDRPSFSSGTAIVPAGHVQFEAGAEYGRDGGIDTLGLPALLTRFGVAPNFELRAGFPSYQVEFRDNDDDVSLSSLRVESKVAGSIARKLSAGLLPALDIPVDTDDGFGRAEFGILGLLSYDIGQRFNVTANGGIQTVSQIGDDPRSLEFPAILALGFAFTDQFGAYLESFHVFAEDQDMRWAVNGGASYAIKSWLVVDAYVGTGLEDSISDFFVGAGVTLLR